MAKTATKVCPREAMKAERNFVRKHMKKGTKGLNNLGEYPKSMAQARRVIVALQDELDKSQSRHRKATDNYRNLTFLSEAGVMLNEMILQAAEDEFNRLNRQIESMRAEADQNQIIHSSQLERLNEKYQNAEKLWKINSRHASENLNDALEYKADRDAALRTLKNLGNF